MLFFMQYIIYVSDEEILTQVKSVSADPKNNSLEFNEFLKMMAKDQREDVTQV